MSFTNRLRILFARVLIALVDYPWRAAGKFLGARFAIKEHYLITRLFGFFGRSYPVQVKYQNPVSTGDESITLALDLCANTQNQYFRVKASEGFCNIRLIPHELPWIELAAQAMRRTEIFVDVGAHIGIYALTIAQAFPNQRVIAIEPNRSNFSKLANNVEQNGLGNVELIHGAVAQGEQEVRFYTNPLNDGGGSIIQPIDYVTGDVVVAADTYHIKHPGFSPWATVDSVRLDQIIDRPSVIKIDVEGAELEVLRSGSSALENDLIDLIVVEVNKDSIEPVVTMLNQAKFDCFLYGQRQPIDAAGSGAGGFEGFDRRQGNIFCLRRHSPLAGLVTAPGIGRSQPEPPVASALDTPAGR